MPQEVINKAKLQIPHHIVSFAGACITTVQPGEMCALNAVAEECSEDFVATDCSCPQGYIYMLQDSFCIGQ